MAEEKMEPSYSNENSDGFGRSIKFDYLEVTEMETESSTSPTIVQQFLIMIEDEEFDEGERIPVVNFRKDVSDPLKAVGYRILASTEWTNGVPHYFLVEGPMSLNDVTLKEMVYDLLRQCDLKAMSGEALIEI